MELGNMVFGNSRGEAEVPRSPSFEGPWQELCDELGIDWYGYAGDGCMVPENEMGELENEVMRIRSYDWDAECDCGADEAMDRWLDANPHQDICYQSELRNRMAEFSHMPYGERQGLENALYDELCAKYGVDRKFGAAVHCTCGRDTAADEEWLRMDGHKDSCRFIQPNFLYKPTGFTINWYKYPFRDSYMTPPITAKKWRDIVRHCIEVSIDNQKETS